MRTNKTLAQFDPAITIRPALSECRCNYQLLGACVCPASSSFFFFSSHVQYVIARTCVSLYLVADLSRGGVGLPCTLFAK